MPTMEANLVAGRAEALVIVHLTRRSDINLVPSNDDAYDLRAMVGAGRKRPFGIRVKGILPASVDPEFARQARNGRSKPTRQQLLSEAEFPVCEMVVNVVSNEITWRWLLEPVCEKAGKRLRTNPNTTLTLLTSQTVEAIVDAVNCWYAD